MTTQPKQKFAHEVMCLYCGVRPRLKQRKGCDVCDPLCRDCWNAPRKPQSSYCKDCYNQRLRARYANDIEYRATSNARIYAWKSANLKELRAAVNEMYGDECRCCGETQPLFLTVDHVNNDGGERRRKSNREHASITLLRDMLRHGVVQDDYQLLCWNCQLGKHLNGGICPHQVQPNTSINQNASTGFSPQIVLSVS